MEISLIFSSSPFFIKNLASGFNLSMLTRSEGEFVIKVINADGQDSNLIMNSPMNKRIVQMLSKARIRLNQVCFFCLLKKIKIILKEIING